MNQSLIDRISDCQASLIDALDNQDVDAIEANTSSLSKLIAEAQSLRGSISGLSNPIDVQTVDFAIRQSAAASIRTNCLANWTRQRIDRLSELRGLPTPNGYVNTE